MHQNSDFLGWETQNWRWVGGGPEIWNFGLLEPKILSQRVPKWEFGDPKMGIWGPKWEFGEPQNGNLGSPKMGIWGAQKGNLGTPKWEFGDPKMGFWGAPKWEFGEPQMGIWGPPKWEFGDQNGNLGNPKMGIWGAPKWEFGEPQKGNLGSPKWEFGDPKNGNLGTKMGIWGTPKWEFGDPKMGIWGSQNGILGFSAAPPGAMEPPRGLALLLLLSAVISGVLGAPGPSGVSGISGIPGRNREELPARSHPAPRRPRSAAGRSWLRWAPFRGRIPAEAVSSPNPRTGRTEFVCSTRGCELGAFDPARGSFCSFAWAEQELRGSDFHLLLNPGGFEALDWVDTSFGSAPEGAVEACPLTDLFVGRSPDGLGKASKEQEALFVAVDGEEVWYKWYQVLVVRQGALGVAIDDVSYNGSAVMESAEPAELTAVLLRNDGCEAADRSITLEELSEVEHGWSAELPALAAARGVLRAAPVLLPERGGWHPGNVTSVPWAGGASLTEFVSRSHRVRLEVPARSECSAVLRGLRREIRVPFSARLTREFRSGRPHRAAVAGWARSSAVTGARAGLERCRPLADLPPCPH
uniref:Uncharacterized protein n=2 Tax=Taeniopygia guttata TaxID=59729 RepID=A0A674HL97_TAEGU